MTFDKQVDQLIEAARRGRPEEIRHWLKAIVPEYNPWPDEGGVLSIEAKAPVVVARETQVIREGGLKSPAGVAEPQPAAPLKPAYLQ